MKPVKTVFIAAAAASLSGCAGLDFGEKGLAYYEPKPFLFVTVNKDCVSTATLVSLPGERHFVKFKSGYGSADLSVALSNGILTNAGQKTDTKVPETITAVAGLSTAISKLAVERGPTQVACTPSAILYPVVNGLPDTASPIAFPIQHQTLDSGTEK